MAISAQSPDPAQLEASLDQLLAWWLTCSSWRSEVRECGRPKKDGSRCTRSVRGFEFGCFQHMPRHLERLGRIVAIANSSGYDQGIDEAMQRARGNEVDEWDGDLIHKLATSPSSECERGQRVPCRYPREQYAAACIRHLTIDEDNARKLAKAVLAHECRKTQEPVQPSLYVAEQEA